MGALKSVGKEILGRTLEPGVCSLFAENAGHLEHGLFIDNFLTAFVAVENGNGNAPFSLTGNTPIVAVSDHGLETVMTPFGNPFNRIDGLYRILAEIGDGAEPLTCRTEKHGLFAAPAMRILVDYFFHGEQRAGLVKINRNGLVGLVGGKSRKALACLVGQHALIVYRHDGLKKIIVFAHVKVLNTEAGSGVKAAGTAFKGDMIAHNDV